MKIGRNDPCPCGSGKKYKKCCLSKSKIEFLAEAVFDSQKTMLNRSKEATENFRKSGSGDLLRNVEHNLDTWRNIKGVEKAKVSSSLLMKSGFDSAYHHVVEPTGSFIRKISGKDSGKITGLEIAATGFSAFGAYEMFNIIDDAAEGNWSSVAGGIAMLAGSKVAFAQGVNVFKGIELAKKHNISSEQIKQGLTLGVSNAPSMIKGTKNLKELDDFFKDTSRANSFRNTLIDTSDNQSLLYKTKLVY